MLLQWQVYIPTKNRHENKNTVRSMNLKPNFNDNLHECINLSQYNILFNYLSYNALYQDYENNLHIINNKIVVQQTIKCYK